MPIAFRTRTAEDKCSVRAKRSTPSQRTADGFVKVRLKARYNRIHNKWRLNLLRQKNRQQQKIWSVNLLILVTFQMTWIRRPLSQPRYSHPLPASSSKSQSPYLFAAGAQPDPDSVQSFIKNAYLLFEVGGY